MNTSTYAGFLAIIYDPERAVSIAERRERDEALGNVHFELDGSYYPAFAFTETMVVPKHQLQNPEICLISFDRETIKYAALARVRRGGVTGKVVVQFSYLVDLGEISFEALSSVMGFAAASYLPSSSAGISLRLPLYIWELLITSLEVLRPETANELERLHYLQATRPVEPGDTGYAIVAQEKDAVGLALKIFDHRGDLAKRIAEWRPTPGELPPFIQGLTSARILEDQMR